MEQPIPPEPMVAAYPPLNLESWPSIFVIPTHLELDELHDIESKLVTCHASLTYDITEAQLVIGKVSQKKRAALELRAKGLWTEDVLDDKSSDPPQKRRRIDSSVKPAKKRETIDLTVDSDLETEVEDHDGSEGGTTADLKPPRPPIPSEQSMESIPPSLLKTEEVTVIKLEWIYKSLESGHPLPLGPFTVYRGRKIAKPSVLGLERATSSFTSSFSSQRSTPMNPLEKGASSKSNVVATPSPKQQHIPSSPSASRCTPSPVGQKHRPKLYRETTSEHESASPIPTPPNWVRDNIIYSCLRSAPLHPPNEAFMKELGKIKAIRELTLDEIGVRAYSTSIASIAAYPYPLQRAEQVSSLPGCDARISNLFIEWKRSKDGTLEQGNQLDSDPVLKVVNLFNNIWGVGAKSARDFYYKRQWRDLDDIVEYGWDSLSRVQQIGVKYYDEFMSGIPRDETESIAETILDHAQRVRPDVEYDGIGVECIVVGGYRRGKELSGDVDVILTHRDDRVTYNLVYDVVASLEQDGWVTHTLALHLTNSNRDQQTLPYRGETGGKPRFDSLDKALVVWQDPYFDETPSAPQMESPSSPSSSDREDESENDASPPGSHLKPTSNEPQLPNDTKQLKANHWKKRPARSQTQTPKQHQPDEQKQPSLQTRKKNPNPHRRVDIVISPFKTVGCAVIGWSGGTTFQRDLRRYAKKVRNWKFDSSGVRAREGSGGRVIDLESAGKTWQERERLVMEGLGIGWRPPEERCTE